MKTEVYHRPTRLEDAVRLVTTRENARYIAGGTDLLVGGVTPPKRLVSLRSVPELRGVEPGRIGAATTIGALTRNADLARDYPVLIQAARRLGSEQIRNQATVGGNLCRAAPCADTAPPLLVLEATLEIAGEEDTREVPIDEFFRGPGVTCLEKGEVLTSIHLPPPREGAVGVFLKKGRVRMDLSLASVAVLLEAEDGHCRRVRLAAGSVAPVPMRLREVEEVLEGEALTDELLEEAGDLAARVVMPITDVRSTEAYRRHVTGVYVKRAIRIALEGAGA
jgi:CO/xanthine dehydrogenase FAD-binding subunit